MIEEKLNSLIKEYSASNRFYHNLEHIKHCIAEFKQIKHLAKDPEALEIAIWYHDIIYDTHSDKNEEKSAELAYETYEKAGLCLKFAKEVKDLILLTKHNTIPKTIDGKILVDIDLAIFGAEEKEFDKYEKNIRKEYSWVSDKLFNQERTKILQSFIDRKNIYATDFFRGKYEAQARNNLKRSLLRMNKFIIC